MPWIYLLLAGLFEIGFAMGLKYSDGFTRLWPTVLTIGLAGISLWFLTQALKTIPVGTGYAIWTGIGALGVTIAGIALFGDKRLVVAIGMHRSDRGRRDRAEAGRVVSPPAFAAQTLGSDWRLPIPAHSAVAARAMRAQPQVCGANLGTPTQRLPIPTP